MKTKLLALGSTVLLVAGLFSIGSMSASAHTPVVTADCSSLSVNLTNYNAKQGEANTVTVTIDSKIVDSNDNFGATFIKNYPFNDKTVAHTWKVDYTAWDDANGTAGWTGSMAGTSQPCVVKDATAEVVITQPTCDTAGTVVPGKIANATWGDVTYSGTDNLTFSVTATAKDNHTFANGESTKTITGTLLPATGACNPPPCLPDSAVSYTYNKVTNSGAITVKAMDGYTGELCNPFWVTAASWTFNGSTVWPQTLDQWNPANDGNQIHTVGTYPYAAAVTCGQGDIYAAFTAPGVPYPIGGVLTAPDTPYSEYFLHQTDFIGNGGVTWTVQDPTTCHVTVVNAVPTVTFTDQCGTANDTVSVPTQTGVVYTTTDSRVDGVGNVTVTATPAKGYTFGADVKTTSWSHDFTNEPCPTIKPAAPSAFDPTCTADGNQDGQPNVTPGSMGYIELDLQPHLHYTIDGQPTTSAQNFLDPGTYTVAVTVDPGYDLVGPSSWQMTINPPFCPPTYALLSTTATMANNTCSVNGAYTLADTEGVQWFVNGSTTPTPAGTYHVTGATTVNVEAKLINPIVDGWEDGAQTNWTFNFTDPADCLPTLAFTGSNGNPLGLLLAGGLLLLGGGAIAFERTFRFNAK